MRCKQKTEWGRCAQKARAEGCPEGLCTVHQHFAKADKVPDRYWHEKVVRGLITPTVEWMNNAELNAIINGRYRGDGRRIDQYITGDPLMIDTEAFE